MGFLRPILLILLLTGLSLAGLTVLGIIFPDAFATGSDGFLVYVVGASLIFLLFWKRYWGAVPTLGGKELGIEPTLEDSEHGSPDTKLEEIRTRIRNLKRSRK